MFNLDTIRSSNPFTQFIRCCDVVNYICLDRTFILEVMFPFFRLCRAGQPLATVHVLQTNPISAERIQIKFNIKEFHIIARILNMQF